MLHVNVNVVSLRQGIILNDPQGRTTHRGVSTFPSSMTRSKSVQVPTICVQFSAPILNENINDEPNAEFLHSKTRAMLNKFAYADMLQAYADILQVEVASRPTNCAFVACQRTQLGVDAL